MATGALGQRKRATSIGLAALVVALGCVLVLITQPFASGDPDPSRLPPTPLEKKAERIEGRLAKSPEDPKLLLASMRAWIDAGNDRLYKARNASRPIPGTATEDLKTGLLKWNSYLRQTGGEASVDNAELAGGTYFSLLEVGSTDLGEIESNAAEAARALQIAGRRRHNLYTLSNVAVYAYFNGEFAIGNRAAKGAAATFDKASRAKIVTEQLDAYRERAETFRRQLRQAAAQLRETGEEQLAEPLKAYASSAGINQEDPSQ